MYKLMADVVLDGVTIESKVIKRKADDALIPKDNNNADYQEYLEWVSEGNTPEEAE
jgi:hypothetical protein